MKNSNFWIKIFAFSLLILALPTLSSAQFGNDDDNYRRDRRNDNSGRRNDNYDNRNLSEAIRRVEKSSDRLTREIDRALDNSRYDNGRREDRINDVTRNFESAADDLKSAYGNGRNLRNSADEAQSLIQSAAQIDRFISRNQLDNRVESEWNQIRNDLQTIASAYNLRLGNRGVYRRNNDDNNNYPRNRRNDDDNNNRRNRRGIFLPF